MQITAIIGDPIIQAKSPQAFGSYFQSHGIEAVMVPLHVDTHSFEAALHGLQQVQNFAGAVITIPHKPLAYQIADERGPMAHATRAANVLVPNGENRWSAEMFDGVGLITALETRGISVAGLHCLLIGAGGAGTAIAVALEQLGQVGSISIADTDSNRALALLAKLTNAALAKPDPGAYQLIVNASPVGMRSNAVPVDISGCSPGTVVCDAIMDPPRTRLLREAKEKGCIIVEGLEMLHGQVEKLAQFMGLNRTGV